MDDPPQSKTAVRKTSKKPVKTAEQLAEAKLRKEMIEKEKEERRAQKLMLRQNTILLQGSFVSLDSTKTHDDLFSVDEGIESMRLHVTTKGPNKSSLKWSFHHLPLSNPAVSIIRDSSPKLDKIYKENIFLPFFNCSKEVKPGKLADRRSGDFSPSATSDLITTQSTVHNRGRFVSKATEHQSLTSFDFTGDGRRVNGELVKILQNGKIPFPEFDFRKGYDKTAEVLERLTNVKLPEFPDHRGRALKKKQVMALFIQNPVYIFFSLFPHDYLDHIVALSPPLTQKRSKKAHCPEKPDGDVKFVQSRQNMGPNQLHPGTFFSWFHDCLGWRAISSFPDCRKLRTFQEMLRENDYFSIGGDMVFGGNQPHPEKDDVENLNAFFESLKILTDDYNNHYKLFTSVCNAVVLDESRTRTPNYNHNPLNGNPIPHWNDDKPIKHALECHTLACAASNLLIALRPVFGAKDVQWLQTEQAYKDELKTKGIPIPDDISKMVWVVLTILQSAGMLTPPVGVDVIDAPTRLLLADSAFMSVKLMQVLSLFPFLGIGPIKTAHKYSPREFLDAQPCTPNFPEDITAGSSQIEPDVHFFEMLESSKFYSPIPKPEHILIHVTRAPFTKPMNFITNFAVKGLYVQYQAYSARFANYYHPKPMVGAIYSFYAGAVDRANRFVTLLGLGETKALRSRFLVRFFQFLLGYVVQNTWQIWNHYNNLTKSKQPTSLFYFNLLQGIRWTSVHLGHTELPWYGIKKCNEWFRNPTLEPTGSRTVAKCQACGMGPKDRLSWCSTCTMLDCVVTPMCRACFHKHGTKKVQLTRDHMGVPSPFKTELKIAKNKDPKVSPSKKC